MDKSTVFLLQYIAIFLRLCPTRLPGSKNGALPGSCACARAARPRPSPSPEESRPCSLSLSLYYSPPLPCTHRRCPFLPCIVPRISCSTPAGVLRSGYGEVRTPSSGLNFPRFLDSDSEVVEVLRYACIPQVPCSGLNCPCLV